MGSMRLYKDDGSYTVYGYLRYQWRDLKRRLRSCDGCGRIGKRKRSTVYAGAGVRYYCDWECSRRREGRA